MYKAAKDYCLIIENVSLYDNSQWLADMARILPRIQTAMARLDDPNLNYNYFALPDLEERFELYCQLKDQLGNIDAYRLDNYDESSEQEGLTGSLASDFADMYFEIKRGLTLYESGTSNQQYALKIWQIGYVLNWKQHIANAQTQLLELQATDWLGNV